MKSINDKDKTIEDTSYEDRLVPLIDCGAHGVDFDWTSDRIRHYCPVFSENDFFYGNWYSKRFSWSRLSLHFCDDTEEAE